MEPPEGYVIKQVNKMFFWVSVRSSTPGNLQQTWDDAVRDAWRHEDSV